MAKDIRRKTQQSKEQGKDHTGEIPQEGQELREDQTSPQSPVFTAEQRRILGRVYKLILSWRRERKAKERLVPATNCNPVHSLTSQPVIQVEVEA